ncbi:MAG: porphobilinogen synthase [Leptospiraceae bacterium]|nr:porphobilinogen synthase [Leptospiraceae bacterium]MCZ8347478.1 porphobilinogen synthase [Leptospiraceae bacterium]
MFHRPRILRNSNSIREMVSETRIQPSNFILPLFVEDGTQIKTEIPSMPGTYRWSLDLLEKELESILNLGIRSVLLFAKVPDNLKEDTCREALNPDGLLPRAIRFTKEKFPELVVMSDIALDPYSPYGHDGLVKKGRIINDETVMILAQMSLVHAQAGANFVAPSDMMDGRIIAIRNELEKNQLTETGILSYSAKYASCLYGPFRDALDSAPGFGDKKTYQMNPANRREAIKEVQADIQEGADIIMVKPAGYYLDIIREVKNSVSIPLAAYQVSGEYAMIKASAARGWLDENEAILESLLAIKRAGADLIATYFAKEACNLLK